MSAEPVFVLSEHLRRGVLRSVGSNDVAVGTAATAMAERLMKAGDYAESAHVALLGRRWHSASHALRCAVARGEISFSRLFTDEAENVSYRAALVDPFLAVSVALNGGGRIGHSVRDELLAKGVSTAASLGEDDITDLLSTTSGFASAELERNLWRGSIVLVALRALGDWDALAVAVRAAIDTLRHSSASALAVVGALRSFLFAQIELALALLGEPEYTALERHRRMASALCADDVPWVLGSVALAAAIRGELAGAKVMLNDIAAMDVAHTGRHRLSGVYLTTSALIALEARDDEALRGALDAMSTVPLADSGLSDMHTILEARYAYLVDNGTRSFEAVRAVMKPEGLPWAHAEAEAFRIERYLAEGMFSRAQTALDDAQHGPYGKWNVLRLALAKSRFAQDQPGAALKIAETVWASDAVTPRIHARALAIGSACARQLGDVAGADRMLHELRSYCQQRNLREACDDLLATSSTPPSSHIRPPLPAPAQRLELTRRQLVVLRALSQLVSADDIAASMHVSKNTIKTQLRHIYRKLGAHSRDQALRVAMDEGLL